MGPPTRPSWPIWPAAGFVASSRTWSELWRVLSHHRLLLRQLVAHSDFLSQQIDELSKDIDERNRPFEV